MLIDTHCHIDAPEIAGQAVALRAQAALGGVGHCIYPAVEVANFAAVRDMAHALGDSYALGIHPMYTPQAADEDLEHLDQALATALNSGDTRLVAVGEIGLDYFVPAMLAPDARAKQERFYRAQLKLARKHGLPVILHVRRSADQLLAGLNDIAVSGGIAHAFNGSDQQAQRMVQRGFALGFGGAVTYERATQLRHLCSTLPEQALVLETDAPDMPPHWLYTTAAQRAAGSAQGVNSSVELPRIAQVVAQLRGVDGAVLASSTMANAVRVLPRLNALLLVK
jgi:TatD DNase family protein